MSRGLAHVGYVLLHLFGHRGGIVDTRHVDFGTIALAAVAPSAELGALAREGNVCELVTAAATAGRARAIGGGSVQGRWHPPGVGTKSATRDEEPEQEEEDAYEVNDP